MDKSKYDMLLKELKDEIMKPYKGKDVEVAVKIRSPYERIGTITEILRSAVEASSLSKFNGALFCFTGKIYEMISWRDIRNIIYDLMKFMNCPMADFTKREFIVRDVVDALEKTPLNVRNEIVVFNNCVLDTDTMKTYPHSKKHAQITMLNYDYDPDAKSALWYQFLNEVLPDAQRRSILQQFLGAVFLDRRIAKIETMLILKGSGSNGKSVVFETVMGVLGRDNVSNFGLGALILGNDRKMNIATMNGKRLNYCSEIQIKEFGANSDSLKAIISGEPIEARRIYGSNFTARNIPLLMANANQLPYMKDVSQGMYRRICVINFDVEIPKERQNKSLARDLESDYPAIFNWIMEGRSEFVKNGYKLPTNHDFENAMEEYQSDYDSGLKFMSDQGFKRQLSHDVTDITPRWMSLASLYDKYLHWCTSNNVIEVHSKMSFSRSLTTAGWRKRSGSYGVEFAVFGKTSIQDFANDKAQKIRKRGAAQKIITIDGKDYGRGREGAAKALGVSADTIARLQYEGKLRGMVSMADGKPVYDIESIYHVLKREGLYMSSDEKAKRNEAEAKLKAMRDTFNAHMKSKGLPFRKYVLKGVNRVDGTIRVDDSMTEAEAEEKARIGDFSSADEAEINANAQNIDWLTEGIEEELQNQGNK